MKYSRTHEEFLKALLLKNKHYRENIFTLLSTYINYNDYIYLQDLYGVCKMKASALLNGYKPSINSAIIKTDYFTNFVYQKNECFRKVEEEVIIKQYNKYVNLRKKFFFLFFFAEKTKTK